MSGHPFNLARKEAFVEALARHGNASQAAREIGIHPTTARYHRDKDTTFALAWDQAMEEFMDGLEAEAVRRAKEGVDEPVFHEGVIVGYKRKYSDSLMNTLLSGRRGKVFGKQKVDVEHSGAIELEAVLNGIPKKSDA